MRSSPPIPWLLGAASVAVVVAAMRSSAVRAPEPATGSHYDWQLLHASGSASRGPFGVGVHIQDVQSNGRVVYASAPAQAFRSLDDGATWEEIRDLRGSNEIEFGDAGLILVGTNRAEIHRSADSGRTWTTIKVEGLQTIPALAIVGSRAYASGASALLRSRDAGATWERAFEPKTPLPGIAARGRVVIAVGGAGLVVRSDDDGASFHEQWLGVLQFLHSVAFVTDSTVIAVGDDGLVVRSTDAGAHWSAVQTPTHEVLRAAAFADTLNGLAVGFWGEAIRTNDGGVSWVRERTGTDAHLFGLSVHPGGGYLASGVRETVLRARPR